MIKFFVDPSGQGKPFPHYWEGCVGSCHAVMGLRSDWRKELAESHRELGFRYVRFHGLLDDAMSVCVRESGNSSGDSEGKLRYSFFNIDSIFDFLLSIGMKPFIELSFMPSALASGTTTCFFYKANITPPADYRQWEALIGTLTRHLVDRYGSMEVRSWFFEIWNEPNLRFFWAGSKEEYFKLYEHAARAIKGVDGRLRVGGPATSVNAWIPDMLDFCRSTGAPIDFVSTHHYPTDDPLWKNGTGTTEEISQQSASEFGQYERGILRKMAGKARDQAGSMPLYYTEWNTSAMFPDVIHDEPYSAAMIAKTIADNDGLVEGYSFWTFSDLFEEGGQFAAPFHGGYGLKNIYGIPKPTYRIFEMLHNTGDLRLPVVGGNGSTVEMLAVRDRSKLSLFAYNHNIPGAEIRMEEVSIAVKNGTPNAPILIARIDQDNANPKKKWLELGSPEYPTPSELAEMEQASRIATREQDYEITGEGITVGFLLPPHGVVFLTINGIG
jgi:xylan 1,4-beta-xylosidase